MDLGELAPEVLDEDLLQASTERNGFLTDELEAPIQGTEDLLLEKGARDCRASLMFGSCATSLSSS